jgi:hypothetical protein
MFIFKGFTSLLLRLFSCGLRVFPFFYIFKGDLDAEKDFESILSLCFCNIFGDWRCASYGTPFLMVYEEIVNDVEWKKG